jgi:hypothetical protein
MQVSIGAQDPGQHRSVTLVGLLPSLAVSFPVAGDRPRVDRIDDETGVLQRHDD